MTRFRWKVITTTIILCVFLLSTFTFFLNTSKSPSIETPNDNIYTVPKVSTYTEVTPFIIMNDTDWLDLSTTYSWCTGTGIASNPYKIKDISIDRDNETSCIRILNTEAFFKYLSRLKVTAKNLKYFNPRTQMVCDLTKVYHIERGYIHEIEVEDYEEVYELDSEELEIEEAEEEPEFESEGMAERYEKWLIKKSQLFDL